MQVEEELQSKQNEEVAVYQKTEEENHEQISMETTNEAEEEEEEQQEDKQRLKEGEELLASTETDFNSVTTEILQDPIKKARLEDWGTDSDSGSLPPEKTEDLKVCKLMTIIPALGFISNAS